jgi:hypothetical protein
MRMARPTIAALMALVLLTGVGLAGLTRPSQLAAAFFFSAATVILTGAIVGALYARGSARAFWGGFAIGGWTYLIFQYAPPLDTQVGPYTLPEAVLDILYDATAPPQPVPTAPAQYTGMMMPSMPPGTTTPFILAAAPASPVPTPSQTAWEAWSEIDRGRVWTGTRAPSSFFRIGHSLLCLLAALGAGLLARWWSKDRTRCPRDRGETSSQETPEPKSRSNPSS